MIPQEIMVADLKIAYKIWGNPQNPPIIALHGWLDNANSFDLVAPFLQDNYYLIAIDLPGHGHSSHLLASSYYHFIDGVFLVAQIIQALKLDKVHLLGHSMGACLASILGGIAPEHFLSISLIEGLGPFAQEDKLACKQLATFLKYLSLPKTKPAKGYSQFENAALARAAKGYVSLDIAKLLCERSIIEKQGVFYWRHDSRLLGPSPLYMTEQQVLSCLEQINAKICLIWANEGFNFDSALVQQRIAVLKNPLIKYLDGGHHIHMEQPEKVGQFLAEFYASLN